MYHILILIGFFTLIPCRANAKTETIYASYKYVMGDNDTKNDAKRICFLEAKRLLIEKAGVFIESETTVTDFKLTKDEIKAYSAAILKVEIANEEQTFNGETQTIAMTVKADIDTDEAQKMLASIKGDKALQRKIINQQEQLRKMENKLTELQDKLRTINPEAAVPLRKERNVIFAEMSEKEKIVFNIKASTQKAIDNIEIRMTTAEAQKIAGPPRSIDGCSRNYYALNYGNVWVLFESDLVKCIVDANVYESGNCFCSSYLQILKK